MGVESGLGRLLAHRVAAIALCCLSTEVFALDQLKLAIGQKGAFENAVAPLGGEAGIFKKHGIELEMVYTQGSGETVQAVISGSADIGVSAGTLGVMSVFAKGAPVRVFGATMHGANDLFWYVRPDSAIKSFRDIGGKTVSYSTRGSSSNTAVLAFKDFFKIAFKETPVGGPAASYTQMMSGQVDVGWSGGTILLDKVLDGTVRLIGRASEVPDLQSVTPRVLIVNLTTLVKRRDVMLRFMAAYRETREWLFSDPKALEAYAKWGEFKLEVAQKAFETTYPKADLNPDLIKGTDLLQRDAVQFKYIPKELSSEQLAELFRVPFK